jgi:oligopeptide transport system substrate-binding protein
LLILPACYGPPQNSGNDRVFRMSIGSEPPTLDWSLATDNVSIDVLNNIMEGLTQFNANLEPVPSIAKRWEFSEDGKTITFHLRDDVFWSDGKPVTAGDFEFSWKRLLNPATAAEYAYFLFDVENAQEYNSGKMKDPAKVGVRALSPLVLQVRLKRPVVYFPSITTFMVTFPQREDIIAKYGTHWTDPGKIVTNGPFVLSEWRHEYKLILTASDSYYGRTSRMKKNSLDKVILFIVREPTTALTLYETGDLDMTGLPPVAIPHYKDSPEYVRLPLLRGEYYGFNTQKPPFDNALVRRAFSYAIDRSRIPEILQGGQVPTSSWIPKGMFGYNPDIGPKFDPEKARSLLAQAGYPDGKGLPPLSAAFNSDPTNRLIAEFIQDQWKKHLNVQVEFDSQEWKVYLNRLKMDPPAIFRLGWGADFPDPDNFMNLFTAVSGNNHLRWANNQYDALVGQGAGEHDPEKRHAIYNDAQEILTETEAPIISLYILAQNRLVKQHVKGLNLNAMELLTLKHVTLDSPEKELATR